MRIGYLCVVMVIVLFGSGSLRIPAAAQDPLINPHGPLSDSSGCVSCHSTEAWVPLRPDPQFDHSGTRFALDGAHAIVGCETCHEDLRFDVPKVEGNDCNSCHLDVHGEAFPQNCSTCHTTESFSQLRSGLVHPANFPLEGAHQQTSCETCHTDDVGGAFTPLDQECVACHLPDYDGTVLMDHAALGFPTNCTECHSMLDWRDVIDFDHADTSGGFELLGIHRQIDCRACHMLPGGGLPTIPTGPEDCISCHLGDYTREHGGSDFPFTCLVCHNQFNWDDADFSSHDADFFPIYSGEHKDEWSNCSDCHQVPTDFSAFTCLSCHEHNKADMDDEHKDVSGYAYDSYSCLSCHPAGNS